MNDIRIITSTGYELDLFDNNQIEISNSIDDLQELNSIKGLYSSSFEIPATPNNNKAFEFYYENVDSFDPKVKMPIDIYEDTILQIVGYLKLEGCNYEKEKIVSYSVVLYAKNSNLLLDIEDKNLEDLTSINTTHIHSFTNILNTWTNYADQDFVYQIADNGQNYKVKKHTVTESFPGITVTVLTGNTYLETMIDDVVPGIKVKTYIDAIFNEAGFSYTCPLFNTLDFSKLIIPFCRDIEFDQNEQIVLANSTFNLERGLAPGWTFLLNNKSGIYDSCMNNTIFMKQYNYVGTQYNSNNYATGIQDVSYFRVPKKGKYGFSISQTVQVYNEASGGFDVDVKIAIIKQSLVFLAPQQVNNVVIKGEVIGSTAYSLEAYYDIPSPVYTLFASASAIELEKDDIVYCVLATPDILEQTLNNKHLPPIRYYGNNTFRVNFQSDDVIFPYVSQWTYQNMVPQDVSQQEFLKSIFTLFNLKLEQDKTNDKNYLIYPRDSFYSGGTLQNWDYKIDNNSIQTKAMPFLEEQLIDLTYDYEDDYYNLDFKENYGVNKYTYGHKLIDTGWKWDKDTKEIKLLFKATALATPSHFENGRTYDDAACYVMSRIWNDDGADLKLDFNQGLRIGYFNYLACSGPDANDVHHFKMFDYTTTPKGTDYNIDLIEKYGSSGLNEYYPYCGHLKYPQGYFYAPPHTPNLDINFETTKYYFSPNYTFTGITNQYELYWFNTIKDLVNKNSKMLTCKVLLSEMELYNLSFRDRIYFDGQIYILNSIRYVLGERLCEVELLTYDLDSTPYVNPIYQNINTTPNGNSLNLGNSNINSVNSVVLGDYNQGETNNSIIAGDSNGIQGTNLIIVGIQNNIQSNNVNVFGNNNYVATGLTGTTIFGDNLTPSAPGFYINGQLYANDSIPRIDVVDGGTPDIDGVQSVYNRKVKINIVDCGDIDAYPRKRMGGDSIVDLIDGNG